MLIRLVQRLSEVNGMEGILLYNVIQALIELATLFAGTMAVSKIAKNVRVPQMVEQYTDVPLLSHLPNGMYTLIDALAAIGINPANKIQIADGSYSVMSDGLVTPALLAEYLSLEANPNIESFRKFMYNRYSRSLDQEMLYQIDISTLGVFYPNLTKAQLQFVLGMSDGAFYTYLKDLCEFTANRYSDAFNKAADDAFERYLNNKLNLLDTSYVTKETCADVVRYCARNISYDYRRADDDTVGVAVYGMTMMAEAIVRYETKSYSSTMHAKYWKKLFSYLYTKMSGGSPGRGPKKSIKELIRELTEHLESSRFGRIILKIARIGVKILKPIYYVCTVLIKAIPTIAVKAMGWVSAKLAAFTGGAFLATFINTVISVGAYIGECFIVMAPYNITKKVIAARKDEITIDGRTLMFDQHEFVFKPQDGLDSFYLGNDDPTLVTQLQIQDDGYYHILVEDTDRLFAWKDGYPVAVVTVNWLNFTLFSNVFEYITDFLYDDGLRNFRSWKEVFEKSF